jgi:hypothetical protein
MNNKNKVGYVPVAIKREYFSSRSNSVVGYLVEIGSTKVEVIIAAKDFIQSIEK